MCYSRKGVLSPLHGILFTAYGACNGQRSGLKLKSAWCCTHLVVGSFGSRSPSGAILEHECSKFHISCTVVGVKLMPWFWVKDSVFTRSHILASFTAIFHEVIFQSFHVYDCRASSFYACRMKVEVLWAVRFQRPHPKKSRSRSILDFIGKTQHTIKRSSQNLSAHYGMSGLGYSKLFHSHIFTSKFSPILLASDILDDKLHSEES